ncbi:hypothetical protein [Arthrobacter sp. Bz4]|uniref:hypothetical protein n=1 Tax=Arthrobacter sp. Bz4 TaxID=2171979 RepID=UPI000D523234|nr:hypothetical protein [Arthrobacter sp. Bz4]PVE17343.1 hypothetical protein DDA93_11045 [Arthrobacter sp. Bz4]
MNSQLRDRLAAEASDRAQSHPAFVDRALQDGMRVYRRHVVLAVTAAVACAVALIAMAALAPRLVWGSPAEERIVGLIIEPGAETVLLGGTVEFVAVAQLHDGSTRPVEGPIIWKSSDTGTAIIATSGQAKSVSPGITTISGSLDGQEELTGRAFLKVLRATVGPRVWWASLPP